MHKIDFAMSFLLNNDTFLLRKFFFGMQQFLLNSPNLKLYVCTKHTFLMLYFDFVFSTQMHLFGFKFEPNKRHEA